MSQFSINLPSIDRAGSPEQRSHRRSDVQLPYNVFRPGLALHIRILRDA